MVVFLGAAHAAEQKEASPIGLTRDQVIARFGEPQGQMVAGARTIMLFPRERLILRDGVVVEVERVAEPVRRGAAAPAATPPPAAPAAAPSGTDTPAGQNAQPTASTAAPAQPAPSAAGPAQPAAATALPTDPGAPAPLTPGPPPPEPKLEIKSVRPSGATIRPAPTKTTTTAITPPPLTPSAPPQTPATAPATPAGSAPASAVTPPSSTATTEPTPTTTETTPTRSTRAAPGATDRAAATVEPADPAPPEEAKEDETAAKNAKDKKIKAAKARRRLAEADSGEEPDLGEAFLTPRTIVISIFVIGAGIGYLVWRTRQRQLLLAATAVSRTPFGAAPVPTGGGGAVFNADLLGKLEWKRFEDLVAEYYVKTGVVAVRTKAGPASPVNIKISWKGEPRPFACVQCLAHPQGLVEAKPLQDLVAVLTAEDIRRGYVVTSGKFSVQARDYAEEKHLTLLPGDIFLEKLNALPEAARAEIMQTVASGDYQTPSCPKCDQKMVRVTDNPSLWRCPTHADQTIPAWK